MKSAIRQPNFAVCLVSAIAALAGLLFGFDTGIISGALLFIQKTFPLTAGLKEFIVSSVLIGAMMGSLGSGYLTDKYGRRGLMLIIALMFITGTLIAALAINIEMIILGRIFIGIAIGIGSYTAPLYIAEAAPAEWRGGLVSLNQLAITIGIMSSYFINYTFINTEASWRIMFAIGIIPAVLLGTGMIFLPESPRWLVKEGRSEQARKILIKLRDKQNVDHEIHSIENSLQIRHAKLSELLAPWIRNVLFLGIFLSFLQQVTGINAIIYYAPTIFQMAGFHDASSSILATLGIGVVNVLSTVFAIFYLDKLGRRPLLFYGLIGMGLSLFCLSMTFHYAGQVPYLRWFAVASTFIYVICFAFSLGALLWLMVSEIFPLELRGAAMGIAVFSCWFANFLVSSTFLTLVNALGTANTFLVYTIMCIAGLAISYYIVPETKGVTLEKIEENIRRGLPLNQIGAPITDNVPEVEMS